MIKKTKKLTTKNAPKAVVHPIVVKPVKEIRPQKGPQFDEDDEEIKYNLRTPDDAFDS